MKRIFVLFLALSLLILCACGSDTPTDPATEPSSALSADSTEVTGEATEEATAETQANIMLYQNPLNGEPMAQPYTGRPTAVIINNAIDAMPQYGISEADIMYELETEGDVTRYMAIFSDLSDVGSIGPVRSARTFFNNIALSFDAPLIHCGGSPAALNAYVDDNGTRISNWNHINQSFYPEYFFRDTERYNNGYSWEHTLFTSGAQLTQALEDKGYQNHTEDFLVNQGDERSYGLQFADEIDLNGETANSVTAVFRYGKTTKMTFNAETGLYEASQYNTEHLDAAAGKCVAYKNVLVLYTSQWSKDDGIYYRSYYQLLGEGAGYFACNGQIIPIKWQRDDYRDCFTYTLEDGTPLNLGIGPTYVGISSAKTYVKYE